MGYRLNNQVSIQINWIILSKPLKQVTEFGLPNILNTILLGREEGTIYSTLPNHCIYTNLSLILI